MSTQRQQTVGGPTHGGYPMIDRIWPLAWCAVVALNSLMSVYGPRARTDADFRFRLGFRLADATYCASFAVIQLIEADRPFAIVFAATSGLALWAAWRLWNDRPRKKPKGASALSRIRVRAGRLVVVPQLPVRARVGVSA